MARSTPPSSSGNATSIRASIVARRSETARMIPHPPARSRIQTPLPSLAPPPRSQPRAQDAQPHPSFRRVSLPANRDGVYVHQKADAFLLAPPAPRRHALREGDDGSLKPHPVGQPRFGYPG